MVSLFETDELHFAVNKWEPPISEILSQKLCLALVTSGQQTLVAVAKRPQFPVLALRAQTTTDESADEKPPMRRRKGTGRPLIGQVIH